MNPYFTAALGAFSLLLGPAAPSQHAHPSPAATLNFAEPALHPYADPGSGREEHPYQAASENDSRLYDFYARQADYYLAGHPVPELLPAFPGLDGGSHGHWGKGSNMDHSENLWSAMDTGNVVGGIFTQGDQSINKAVAVRLGPKGSLNTLFDPETLNYRYLWSGSFTEFPSLRWGLMGPLKPGSAILYQSPSANPWHTETAATPEFRYLGYFLRDGEVAFRYRIHDAEILDHPSSRSGTGTLTFSRVIEVGPHASTLLFRLPTARDGKSPFLPHPASEALRLRRTAPDEIYLELPPATATVSFALHSSFPADSPGRPARVRLDSLESTLDSFRSGGPRQWPFAINLPSKTKPSQHAYAVDDLPVPLGNPYLSPLFLTGIAFLPGGDALVTTFFGDVWRLSGLEQASSLVSWRRIATGLHQPLGIETLGEEIYVIGRDQLTRLEDLNQDGEIDAYHCVSNQFPTSAGSHDYHTGLQKDAAGRLYFAARNIGAYRISKDGSGLTPLASGIRNPNGLGVSAAGRVVTAPQEGEWTPASMIIDITRGGYFGFLKHRSEQEIDPPLVYVPRGIDNSTGGQIFVQSPAFGPLDQKLLALSYGYNSHYLVLEDERSNGAVVPLPGEFLSGVQRGRINPLDGQLYLVGSRGWGTYAQLDGSIHRIRYTQKAFRHPSGFEAFSNGLRLDFEEELDPQAAARLENYFAQQWNYKYTAGYGSPEYSVAQPENFGHDPVPIRKVHLLGNRKSLFVEIPALRPVMQLHLRLHLAFADGAESRSQIFATLSRLTESFDQAPGLAPLQSEKPRLLKPLIQPQPIQAPPPEESDASLEPGRRVELTAIAGLSYDKSSLQVKAGERITLQLKNADQMPHNWVLVQQGAYQKIGALADGLAADPAGFALGYVPQSDDVLAALPVLNPGETKTLTFLAPSRPGTYVYLCTYPGHWRVMRGSLIVY